MKSRFILATLLGARLGHVFFYDWEYYRNHLAEILLPIREKSNERILYKQGSEITGFQGLASHGAAIAIIFVMYFYSKNVLIYETDLIAKNDVDSFSFPFIFKKMLLKLL